MSTSTSPIPPLLNAEQVGKIIQRHPKYVLMLARERRITCIRQDSGSVEFTMQHVLDYLASLEVPAITTPAQARPTRNPKYGETTPAGGARNARHSNRNK